jgi:hypothetical protein
MCVKFVHKDLQCFTETDFVVSSPVRDMQCDSKTELVHSFASMNFEDFG